MSTLFNVREKAVVELPASRAGCALLVLLSVFFDGEPDCSSDEPTHVRT